MNNLFILSLKLIRPLNLFLTCLTITGVSILLNRFLFSEFYFSLFTASSFLMASNLLNDFLDKNADAINKPAEFLTLNQFNKNSILIFISSFYFIGVLSSFFIADFGQKIALIIILPILILYTKFLKRIPFLGNVCIGCITAMVFPFTEAALTNKISNMWVPFFLAAFLSTIRELAKDIEDIKGDSMANITTFPVRCGETKSIVLLRILTIIFFSFTILLWYVNYYGYFYLLLMLFGIHLPLFLGVFFLIKFNFYNNNYKFLSQLLKGITIMGVFIIFIIEYN